MSCLTLILHSFKALCFGSVSGINRSPFVAPGPIRDTQTAQTQGTRPLKEQSHPKWTRKKIRRHRRPRKERNVHQRRERSKIDERLSSGAGSQSQKNFPWRARKERTRKNKICSENTRLKQPRKMREAFCEKARSERAKHEKRTDKTTGHWCGVVRFATKGLTNSKQSKMSWDWMPGRVGGGLAAMSFSAVDSIGRKSVVPGLFSEQRQPTPSFAPFASFLKSSLKIYFCSWLLIPKLSFPNVPPLAVLVATELALQQVIDCCGERPSRDHSLTAGRLGQYTNCGYTDKTYVLAEISSTGVPLPG